MDPLEEDFEAGFTQRIPEPTTFELDAGVTIDSEKTIDSVIQRVQEKIESDHSLNGRVSVSKVSYSTGRESSDSIEGNASLRVNLHRVQTKKGMSEIERRIEESIDSVLQSCHTVSFIDMQP